MNAKFEAIVKEVLALIAFVVIGANVVADFQVLDCADENVECAECSVFTWEAFHADAVAEYEDEFTALFNSYAYKVSKNGRSMINGKFVAMPKVGK